MKRNSPSDDSSSKPSDNDSDDDGPVIKRRARLPSLRDSDPYYGHPLLSSDPYPDADGDADGSAPASQLPAVQLVEISPTRRTPGGLALEVDAAPGSANFSVLVDRLQSCIAPTHADVLEDALTVAGHDADASSSSSSAAVADSDADSDDDDDSSAASSSSSINDFVVDDSDDSDVGDGRVVYSDADSDGGSHTLGMLASLRTNYGMGSRDCFRSLLYYVARCALNKNYVRAIKDVTEQSVLNGRQSRQMWHDLVERATSLIFSSVWPATVVRRLHSYCLAALINMSKEDVALYRGTDCQVCRRRGHPIVRKLVLMGVFDAESGAARTADPAAYDGKYLYDDARTMKKLHAEYRRNGAPSGVSADAADDVPIGSQRTVVLMCGVHCAERMYLYHQLVHFWQMCGWRCFMSLDGKARTGTLKQRALRVLDGNEQRLERQCWSEFRRLSNAADEYRPGGRHASAHERFD